MKLRLAALLVLTMLGGCRHAGDITEESGGGVYAVRSTCPIVGVPTGTGDITLFNPPASTDSRAIDVTAAMTDVRATCQDVGNDVVSVATFTIVALRRDAGPARQVLVPYFDVALQGGAKIVANHPVGPLAGVAFNLTLLSYNHSLDMGVNIDTAAVEDPALLRRCLERAFKDLLTV